MRFLIIIEVTIAPAFLSQTIRGALN